MRICGAGRRNRVRFVQRGSPATRSPAAALGAGGRGLIAQMFDILKVNTEKNTVRTTQLDYEDGYSAQTIADSRGITFGGINPGNTREAIGQKVRGRCPDAPAVHSCTRLVGWRAAPTRPRARTRAAPCAC